eukprot:PITA_15066
MDVASDLLSQLPDDLLRSILSEVPFNEAVRSCILSKRRRYLHTELPKLVFAADLFMVNRHPDPLSITKMENVISDILLSHSTDLETFHLYTYSTSFPLRFSSENVWKWIQLVASKNIQHLSLHNFPTNRILPPSVFCCKTLTRLEISNYKIFNIPPKFGGFQHLITCVLEGVIFNDGSLDRLISLCPQLENLSILDYFGPWTINISASKIKTLCFSAYKRRAKLYINCPSLICLELPCAKHSFPEWPPHIKDLRVNGLLFQELSSAVLRLEMQGGANLIQLSLVRPTGSALGQCGEAFVKRGKLSLGRGRGRMLGPSVETFVKIMRTFKSLKQFTIYNARSLEWEEDVGIPDIPIRRLLQCLPHLQRVDLKHLFSLEFGRDPGPTCQDSPMFNVRTVNVFLHHLNDKEMAVIYWLLETALALQTMEVKISQRRVMDEEKYKQFLAKLKDLKGAESRAEISVMQGNRVVEIGR